MKTAKVGNEFCKKVLAFLDGAKNEEGFIEVKVTTKNVIETVFFKPNESCQENVECLVMFSGILKKSNGKASKGVVIFKAGSDGLGKAISCGNFQWGQGDIWIACLDMMSDKMANDISG